jgi:hypothetical protein
MIPSQNLDMVVALPPTSVASAASSSAAIDTFGYHAGSFLILSGPATAATAPSALSITECDTAGGAYAAVPATVGGAAYAIPVGSTAAGGNVYAVFNLDLRRRKRFLKINITNTVTQTLSMMALLYRGDASPVGTTTPANVGVSGIVITA